MIRPAVALAALALLLSACTTVLIDETYIKDGATEPPRDGGGVVVRDGATGPLDNGVRLIARYPIETLFVSRPILDATGECVVLQSGNLNLETLTITDDDITYVYAIEVATGAVEEVAVTASGERRPDPARPADHALGDAAGSELEADGVVRDGCRDVVFSSNQVLDGAGGLSSTGRRAYRRDRAEGDTRQVGPVRDPFGTQASSFTPTISGDGSVVVLVAGGFTLDPDSTSNDEYIVAREGGAPTLLPLIGPGGVRANAGAHHPVLSGDGEYFVGSVSRRLFGHAEPGTAFGRVETRTGIVDAVHGAGAERPSETFAYRISRDGTVVVFTSHDDVGVDPPSEGGVRVYVTDFSTGETTWVNRDEDGSLLSVDNHAIALSEDGRYVVLQANGPRGERAGGGGQIYRYDRETGEYLLITTSYGGAPVDGACSAPDVDADGSTITFFCTLGPAYSLPPTAGAFGEPRRGLFVWEE